MGRIFIDVERIGRKAAARELLHCAWGLEGVTNAAIGHLGMKPLEENVFMVKAYFAEKE